MQYAGHSFPAIGSLVDKHRQLIAVWCSKSVMHNFSYSQYSNIYSSGLDVYHWHSLVADPFKQHNGHSSPALVS
jgi:hypothetical protein